MPRRVPFFAIAVEVAAVDDDVMGQRLDARSSVAELDQRVQTTPSAGAISRPTNR